MKKRLKTVIRLLQRRYFGKLTPALIRNHPGSRPALPIDWIRVGLMAFTIVALSTILSVHLLPDKLSLNEGDLSPQEIRASRSVRYINTVKTERQKELARQSVPAVYDPEPEAEENARRIVVEFYDALERERAPLAKKPELVVQSIIRLKNQFGSLYSATQLNYLLTVSPSVLQQLRATTLRLIGEAMEREIREETADLTRARQDVINAARAQLLPEEQLAVIAAISQQALQPNRRLNRRRTETQRALAARAVGPVYERILRGDRIIAPGERVTREHLDKFTALGLLHPHLDLRTGISVAVLTAAMVFLVVYYIRHTLPALYACRRRLALLMVIVLLSVCGLKLSASLLGLSFSSGQLGYLGMTSVAAAGMLVCVLLDRNLAVLIVALLAVQSGLIMNHEIRFTVMTLMSSLVGIAAVGGARRKDNLVTTTIVLAGANLFLVGLLALLLRDTRAELLTGAVWAIGAAAFAVFLHWFGVLMLEKPFGILTHTTLLELSAFDRPLLTQLCAVAPGTYAHSILVGTLAEAGAQAIGADALLCRVGGYYHDIGKIKRPEFFVENQRGGNVHQRLSPSLSALIITAHVRDGLEMAKQYRLPLEIRDIIAQHHGTTLIRYFYHQAMNDVGASGEIPPGLEERFRYPGPKPQTREAAIIMLADSVEAAARCQGRPDVERLESLIASITRDKIEDHQLDECELTIKDLKAISTAFLHVLKAMMHGRIDYPEPVKTGTGRPMEVSRPDLKPEPIRPADEPEALYSEVAAITDAEPEAVPIVPVSRLGHRRHPYRVGKRRTENRLPEERPNREPNGLPSGDYPVAYASADSGAASLSGEIPALSLLAEEPEELYARLTAEYVPAPDSDDSAATGGPTPANGGRTELRGG